MVTSVNGLHHVVYAEVEDKLKEAGCILSGRVFQKGEGGLHTNFCHLVRHEMPPKCPSRLATAEGQASLQSGGGGRK